MTDPITAPGAHMREELLSQPETWARAAAMRDEQKVLPGSGQRVAVIGCGTSWFMAQSYAALRERAGHGVTDAYAASEAFLDRDYDAIVALTRSGTTSEVLEVASQVKGRIPVIGVIGDPTSPLVALADESVLLPFADEQSVVQTRFATTALTLMRASLGLDADVAKSIEDAAAVLAATDDEGLTTADQYTFLGRGWTIGLAHEAALKMRESSQSWTESYPSMDYRHGPIAIAAPGRITWQFGVAPEGLAGQVEATGGRFVQHDVDPLADLARLHRVALDRAVGKGLDPDMPRNLSRSVILDA
ncbi:SIS domain-containing protein [Microbacterium sp. A196]|uniref:SIS domain-containing protein n=1 Tax=unclassified Microbacterium TaxID=2609290 RepID=UPI003FD09B29